jgi:EpsI family protein
MTNKTFVICLLIFVGTIISVVAIASRGEPRVVQTNLENIPMMIGDYWGTEDFFPEGVSKELNADKYVYRHYKSKRGEQIDLYIGYYGTAKGGRTPHNPHGCLPAAGWGIVCAEDIEIIPNGYYSGAIKVNYILSQKGPLYRSVLHWYQSDGDKLLSSALKQNLHRLTARIMRNRNDGAYVEVSMNSDHEGIPQAKSAISKFAKEVLNLLHSYWPLEK